MNTGQLSKLVGAFLFLVSLIGVNLSSSSVQQTAFSLPSYSNNITAPSVYDDEFNDPTLNPNWSWYNEDPNRWSLTTSPGNLRLITAIGDLRNACGYTAKNVLTQQGLNGDFEIETKLAFYPTQNYHQAGLFFLNSLNTYVKLGLVWNSQLHAGQGIAFTYVENGELTSQRYWMDADLSQPIFLKIQKFGTSYKGYYSHNGQDFTQLNTIVTNAITNPQLGLYAYNSCFTNPSEIPADFDYFRVKFIPVLDLPFNYIPLTPRAAFLSRTKSVFDHDLPLGFSGEDGNDMVTSYLGIPRPSNPATAITSYDQHNGYDFSGRLILDGQVRAPADGTVTWGYDSSTLYSCTLNGETFQTRSCMATIDHDNGWQTQFLHLARIGGTDYDPVCFEESSGQIIQTGESIGQIGNTGCSTSSHIHMEVLHNDIVLDPSGWQGDVGNNDPWEENPNGTASFELWNFSVPRLETYLGINGDNGATFTTLGSNTLITIPAGAFSGIWDFSYLDVPVAEPSNDLIPTGHSFTFEGTQVSQPLTTAGNGSGEFTITISYTDPEVLNIRESSLRLYWWDEKREVWKELSTSLNIEMKTATISTQQFGLFAFLGEDAFSYQFLPIMIR